MSCTNPVRAWRRPSSLPDGVSPVDFTTGEILEPPRRLHFNPQPGFETLQVGCGSCNGCRADRAREWAIRCYHEASLRPRNSFLTLTYADAPESLVKKDLQDFFKRARHEYKFRYLACGEYGESTRRPHYHALIFGEDFLEGKIDISSELYTNKKLADLWGHGMVSVGELNMATCCYVAGYVFKKIGDEDTFSLCSRRPGIGHGWLNRYGDDITRTGVVVIEGKEYPVPHRYFHWKEADFYDLKKERAARFSSQTFDQARNRELMLPAKAKNQAAKLSLKGKKL